MFGRSKPQPVSGLPTIGQTPGSEGNARPADLDPKTYKELESIANDFIDEIKESGYIEVVEKLAQFLENQALIKEVINKDVPRVWDIFGEKIAKSLAKITDKEEREKQLTQQDFAVIWQLFARRHNKRLQNLKFADFVNAERENNERKTTTSITVPDDNNG